MLRPAAVRILCRQKSILRVTRGRMNAGARELQLAIQQHEKAQRTLALVVVEGSYVERCIRRRLFPAIHLVVECALMRKETVAVGLLRREPQRERAGARRV